MAIFILDLLLLLECTRNFGPEVNRFAASVLKQAPS